MAEFMRRHQDSMVRFEKNQMGCMWRFLHLFDFYRHLHVHKMLTDGTKRPKVKQYASSSAEEHDLLITEAGNSETLEDEVSTRSKPAGKSLRSLISRRFSKKQDKKKKASPLASKLQRTISIHYLECNDYVSPTEMASDSETSTVDYDSCENDSVASSDHGTLQQEGLGGTIREAGHADHVQLGELGNKFLENQVVLMEKLNKAKDAWLKLKGSIVKDKSSDNGLHHSKDLLDIQNLFNTNRELFMQISQEPNSAFAEQVQGVHSLGSDRELTKYVSFPGSGLSGRKEGSLSRFKQEGAESGYPIGKEGKPKAGNLASLSDRNENILQDEASRTGTDNARISSTSEFSIDFPCRLDNQSNGVTVSSRLNDLRCRIKDVMRENRKEKHRISMDRLLHKLPQGNKVSENVKEERLGTLWDGPTSDKLSRDGLCKFGGDGSVSANTKIGNRSIRRSHSLTESIASYARLLESNSFRESPRLLGRSKSIREDAAMQDRKYSKTLGRNLSNPDFASSLQIKHLLEDDGAVYIGSSYVEKSADSKLNSENIKEEDAFPQQFVEALVGNRANEALEKPEMMDGQDQNLSAICECLDALEAKDESHSPAENIVHLNDGEKHDHNFEKPMLKDEADKDRKSEAANNATTEESSLQQAERKNNHDQNQSERCNGLDDPKAKEGSTDFVECMVPVSDADNIDGNFEILIKNDEDGQTTKPEFPYDLGAEESSFTNLHEQEVQTMEESSNKQVKPSPISVLDLCFQEEPVSPANYTVLEEDSELSGTKSLVSLASTGNQVDQCNVVEDAQRDHADATMQLSTVTDADDLHVPVEAKYDAELEYLEYMLKKSGFRGDTLPREWYSPYPEVDHSLLPGESNGSNKDLDSDTSSNHQLLFGLMNEVLVETYVRSFSYWPGFMHFNSRTRPMPMGYHVLEEVWGNVSWHLSSQAHQYLTLESIVARDFTKNDGWMNLRWDTECVGLELEAMMFEDLLDEAVFEDFLA